MNESTTWKLNNGDHLELEQSPLIHGPVKIINKTNAPIMVELDEDESIVIKSIECGECAATECSECNHGDSNDSLLARFRKKLHGRIDPAIGYALEHPEDGKDD